MATDSKDFVVIFDSYAGFESPMDLEPLEQVSGGINQFCPPNRLCNPPTVNLTCPNKICLNTLCQ